MIKKRVDNRIAYWDNVRFLMITLVVIGHFADFVIGKLDFCKSIFVFIYAFHMPVFLFVSGLFYKKDNYIKKSLYYIFCGLAIKVFLSVVQYIINHNTSFILLADGNTPWFFFVLASYQMLLHVLKGVNLKFILVFSVIIACFVGYDQTIGDYLYLSRTIVFFPFYILGILIHKETLLDFITNNRKKLYLIATLLISVWLYVCVFEIERVYGTFRALFVGRNPFYPSIIPYGPLARLICYIVSLLTGFSIIAIVPKKRIPLVTYMGSRTEYVYFWHYGLYQLMAKYLGIELLIQNQGWIGLFSFFVIAIILVIMISTIWIFSFPLKNIRKQVFTVE